MQQSDRGNDKGRGKTRAESDKAPEIVGANSKDSGNNSRLGIVGADSIATLFMEDQARGRRG